MKLSNWIEKHSTNDLLHLAQKCGCHPNYLYQVARQGCGPGLAKKIEVWTMKLTPEEIVTRQGLRPDIWDE